MLIVESRSVETRNAWRLAGVWHAVGNRYRHHEGDGGISDLEGDMFVLEVAPSGTVTGRALPTSKQHASLGDSIGRTAEEDSFEMINVQLGEDNRVCMTQIYPNGIETQWEATLYEEDQMVDGRWSGNGWSSGFTALRLPQEEAAALLATGRSVATAPSWSDRSRRLLGSPMDKLAS